MRYVLIFVIAVVAVSGCASLRGSGFSVAMQADPPIVFSETATTIHMDFDNRQSMPVRNVVAEIFDTGLLGSDPCSVFIDRMLPYEFRSLSCPMLAPRIDETSVQTEVNSRVSFEAELSANNIFEIIDENEYQRRSALGKYEPAPRSYVYRDSNVAIEVLFSENPPLVTRSKKYFAYFTITNSGDGFVKDIQPGELVIRSDVLHCPDATVLVPNGKEFPRLACEVIIPRGYLTSSSHSSNILVTLAYRYEVRDSITLNIIR